MDVIFDTEMSDPDDFFALCLLACHPQVSLRAVTVTPGTRQQVGVVRHALARLARADVPVGARDPESPKHAVSSWHYDFLGPIPPAEPDSFAHDLLARTLAAHPAATVITGAPLHNLRLLLQHHPEATIHRWVGQGGFAGDNVVPPEHRLPKFAGKLTCATFNFGGNPKAAEAMLQSPRVLWRELVSKNVAHGVVYDPALHDRVRQFKDSSPGLSLLHSGMDHYLQARPGGKMFHDPLAACIAIDSTIATWREVRLYRSRGEWGSEAAERTNTFITIAIDHDRFFSTLVARKDVV